MENKPMDIVYPVVIEWNQGGWHFIAKNNVYALCSRKLPPKDAFFLESSDIYPEDLDNFSQMERQLSNKPEELSIQLRIRSTNGSYLWCLLTVQQTEQISYLSSQPRQEEASWLAVIQNIDPLIHTYRQKMRDQIVLEREIEADMERALEQKEFKVYLQGKVDIQNGFPVTGAEALVRWQRRDGSLLSPGVFIPLFEKNSFIVSIDRYVFEEVCRYLNQRIHEGKSLFKISVNVSRITLFQPDFIETYTKIKKMYDIPDYMLELECTESVAIHNFLKINEISMQMRKQGFKFSMDDFGAGESSLSALKNLNIDVLKLDMEFFKHGLKSEKDRIIVANIISMAKELGMQVIAQGVEELGEVYFLQRVGCNLVQGYVFTKPVPMENFINKLNIRPIPEPEAFLDLPRPLITDGESRLLDMIPTGIIDMAKQMELEQELYVQQARYQILEALIPDNLFDYTVENDCLVYSIIDANGKISHRKYANYMKQLRCQSLKRPYPKHQALILEHFIEAQKKTMNGAFEYLVKMEKDEYEWHQIDYASIGGTDGKIVRIVGRIKNIHNEVLERERMKKLADTDPLTGLLNRNAISKLLETYYQTEHTGQNYAFFMLDIDAFKQINDCFGHIIGDETLIKVAQVIDGIFCPPDITGRYGGDEFIIFSKKITIEQIQQKAADLKAQLQKICVGHMKIPIQCSAGIIFSNEENNNIQKLLQEADQLMYQVKKNGKNHWKISESGQKHTP